MVVAALIFSRAFESTLCKTKWVLKADYLGTLQMYPLKPSEITQEFQEDKEVWEALIDLTKVFLLISI